MDKETSIISLKETISTEDSKKVKRSKLLYAGIKPKDGYEGAILSVSINIAKKNFLEKISIFKIEDLFNEKKLEDLIIMRKFTFGERDSLKDFFKLNSLTIEYFFENSFKIQEEFSQFISQDLTAKEYKSLEDVMKLDILLKMYHLIHKKTFQKFFQFLIDNEKSFIINFVTGTTDFPQIKNTIKTRELASLKLFIPMLEKTKKQNLINSFKEKIELFEEKMFFNNEEDIFIEELYQLLYN